MAIFAGIVIAKQNPAFPLLSLTDLAASRVVATECPQQPNDGTWGESLVRSTLIRTLSLQVNDGLLPSNIVTRGVTVLANRGPPVVSGLNGTTTSIDKAVI